MNDPDYSLNNNFKYCYYSSYLIKKILLLNRGTINKVDVIKIKKAINYAKKYHANQMRKSGEPYYTHPLIVAGMVADYCFKTDVLITAILHDTMEDTNLTKDTIINVFGINVANNVEDLTRIKPYGKITSSVMVKLLWAEKKYDLLIIKYFDRLHNLQTINAKSPGKIQKTIQETIEQFISLGLYLEKNNMPDLMTRDDMNIVKLCLNQASKKAYNKPSKNNIVEILASFVNSSLIANIFHFIRYKLTTIFSFL